MLTPKNKYVDSQIIKLAVQTQLYIHNTLADLIYKCITIIHEAYIIIMLIGV